MFGLGDIYMVKMIEGCVIGVAVKNANPVLRDVAEQICETNNNDGVVHWIKCNIL